MNANQIKEYLQQVYIVGLRPERIFAHHLPLDLRDDAPFCLVEDILMERGMAGSNRTHARTWEFQVMVVFDDNSPIDDMERAINACLEKNRCGHVHTYYTYETDISRMKSVSKYRRTIKE